MADEPAATSASDPVSSEARAWLSALDTSWSALQAALDGIPETHFDRPGVCGEWSIRTLQGHIAFWDRYSLNRARNALAGKPPLDVAADPLNADDTRAHAANTAAENRTAMEEAHAGMLAFIAGVDPASPRFAEMLYQMSVDTNEHYDEHAAHIRAWRSQVNV